MRIILMILISVIGGGNNRLIFGLALFTIWLLLPRPFPLQLIKERSMVAAGESMKGLVCDSTRS